MDNGKAYRLGSMAQRVYHARLHPRWPEEEPCRAVLDLIDEWLATLTEVKGKPLMTEVETLKAAVEADVQDYLSQTSSRKQQRRYEVLRAMGEQVEPTISPTEPSTGPNSLELAKNLIDNVDAMAYTAALPLNAQQACELGQLVAQCRYADADEVTTQRIAELVKSLASEQWLTGSLSSAASAESLHRTVTNRITELDHLLSTLPWPASVSQDEGADAHDSPYLTIPEAAKLLRVGEETIERLIANGELPAIQLTGRGTLGGRRLKRIMRESLDAFMKERQTKKVDDKAPRRKRPKPGGRDYFA